MRLLFILIFLNSCTPKETSDNVEAQSVDISSMNRPQTFDEFLIKFTMAAISKDSIELRSMTNFPLETRGDLDSSPIITYSEIEFDKIFFDFITRPTGTNRNNLNETQLDILKRANYIEPGNVHRIGDMIFKKVDDKWKLAFIYYWVYE